MAGLLGDCGGGCSGRLSGRSTLPAADACSMNTCCARYNKAHTSYGGLQLHVNTVTLQVALRTGREPEAQARLVPFMLPPKSTRVNYDAGKSASAWLQHPNCCTAGP